MARCCVHWHRPGSRWSNHVLWHGACGPIWVEGATRVFWGKSRGRRSVRVHGRFSVLISLLCAAEKSPLCCDGVSEQVNTGTVAQKQKLMLDLPVKGAKVLKK